MYMIKIVRNGIGYKKGRVRFFVRSKVEELSDLEDESVGMQVIADISVTGRDIEKIVMSKIKACKVSHRKAHV